MLSTTPGFPTPLHPAASAPGQLDVVERTIRSGTRTKTVTSTAGAHDNVHIYVRDQLQIDFHITYWNVQSNNDTTVLTMLGDPVVGTGHCSRGPRSPADDLGGSGRSFVSLCGLLAGCGSRSSTSKDESAGTGGRSLAPCRCRASFGSVLGDSLTDKWTIIAMAVATAVVIIAFYRPLLFTTFDPEVADVSGVNTARIDALLMLLLTFAILASMKVLGVTLIAAALVIPPTVVRLLTNSFKRMLIISTSIAAASGSSACTSATTPTSHPARPSCSSTLSCSPSPTRTPQRSRPVTVLSRLSSSPGEPTLIRSPTHRSYCRRRSRSIRLSSETPTTPSAVEPLTVLPSGRSIVCGL